MKSSASEVQARGPKMCRFLPRVTRCCFCFSLRTGSFIIGYLSLFAAILIIVGTLFSIFGIAAYVAQEQQKPPAQRPRDINANATAVYIILGLMVAIYTCYAILCLLLVIGTHQNKPSYIRFFYIVGMVSLGMSLFIAAVGFIFVGFVSTVLHLVSCGIQFYFLMVIRSLFLEIRESGQGPYAMHVVQTSPLMNNN